jgi:hypothetical protein
MLPQGAKLREATTQQAAGVTKVTPLKKGNKVRDFCGICGGYKKAFAQAIKRGLEILHISPCNAPESLDKHRLVRSVAACQA